MTWSVLSTSARGRGGESAAAAAAALELTRATVKRVLFMPIIVAVGAAREVGGLAHSRVRGKGFSS